MLSIGIDVSKGKSTVCGMKREEKSCILRLKFSTRGKGFLAIFLKDDIKSNLMK